MILTVAFGKGGTGKTSTAAALVNLAKMKGKRTLAIDCDPQANFTFALQGNPTAPGTYDVLTGNAQAMSVIQHTPQTDLLAAGLSLAAAEQAIAGRKRRDYILKDAIQPLLSSYDLIVIDTQPDLNSILINALAASDAVLLPMQASPFAMMGLYQMKRTIAQVQQRCNPNLTIAGILLTKYKSRQTLASDLRESIAQQAEQMQTKVFNTFIREGVAVEQAQAMQQSLFDFAPRSNPAMDYAALYAEMNL